METKYGVISDLHRDPRIIVPTLKVLKDLGAQKIVANGDIGELEKDLKTTQARLAFILDKLGKSESECFVYAGSHEVVPGFKPVMEHFAENHDNIFTVSTTARIEYDDHHVVFLPGSDVNAGGIGEYTLGTKFPTDIYLKIGDNKLLSLVDAEEDTEIKGFLDYENINDLRDKVKNPEKTIVFCHVPRRFDNLEEAVDMAEFGVFTENFSDRSIANGKKLKKGTRFPMKIANGFIRAGYPVELKKENVGNKDLKNIYEAIGITKAVSSHLHESGHRANDSNGNHVEENTFVDDLFWNSGHLDAGQTGILTVRDGKVSYKNIRLQDYV